MADRELKIKVTTDTSGAQHGVNALRGSFTELQSKIGIARQGLQAVGDVYRATVGELLEYADAVGDLSSITGETTESTSRFITVLGDFGIGMGEITAAGRAMRDEGLAPTLETLAQLSDRYLALAPGMARVNFLQETFGRQGAEFVDVLSEGSTAILERADAVADANVLTQQEIDQADDLRVNLAELNDAYHAVTRTIANVVIPVLGNLLDDEEAVERQTRRTAIALEEAAIHDYSPSERATRGWQAHANAIRENEIAAAGADGALADYATRIVEIGRVSLLTITQLDALTQSTIAQMIQAAAARDTVSGYAAAIASLQDRHITITTSLVEATAQWQAAQGNVTTSAWHPYSPTVGTSGQRSLDQRASGGYLGRGWDLVGDAGPELISPWGEVIPASRTMSMLRGGLIPRHKFAYGTGEQGGYIPRVTTGKPPLHAAMEILGWGSTTRGGGKIDGGGGDGTAGGGVTIGAIVEEVQQASAQQSAAVAATIPAAAAAAAGEQSRALVAETSRSNAENNFLMRQILREIAKLNRTLPVAFRDSVERML